MRVSAREPTPEDLSAQVTGTPLPFTPRLALDISKVIVGDFTDRSGFDRQLPGTFGSQQWLWSEDNDLLFGKESRGLQYAVLMPVCRSSPGTMTGRAPWDPGRREHRT